MTKQPEKSGTPDATLAAKPGEKPPVEGEKKPADARVVPDKYEFTAPEGHEVNQEVIDEVTPVLKELGVDQAGANKLFDFFSKHTAKSQTDMVEFYDNMRADWRKEIVADKDIGNAKDGLSPVASQNIAAAINTLPADLQTSFKDAMNITGAGDNPAFVRALSALGAALREGTHVQVDKPSPTGQRSPNAPQPSSAARLFPNLPSSSAS